jgi:hypothetical protein
MNKIITAFILIVMFFSCRSKTGNDIDSFTEQDFSESIELTGSRLEFDAMIMRPVNIHIHGNLLFLQNYRTLCMATTDYRIR